MSFIFVNEKLGQSYDADFTTDTATRVFELKSDDKNDRGDDALRAIGIQPNDPWPKNNALLARQFNAQQDRNNWSMWMAEITYLIPAPEDISPDDLNPFSYEERITVTSEEIPVGSVLGRDINTGEPIAFRNSAGDPTTYIPEGELSLVVIDIERNEPPNISMQRFADYSNVTNSNAFTFGDLSIAPGQSLLTISAGPKTRWQSSTVDYRRVAYNLRVNPLGWDHVVPDQGWNYLDPSAVAPDNPDGKVPFAEYRVVPAENIFGFGITGSAYVGMLNGSGAPIRKDDDPVFITIPRYRRRDYSILQLPPGP